MSRSLTLSEDTYRQLADTAQAAGFTSIEAYLDAHFRPGAAVSSPVGRLHAMRELRERVSRECGALPHSIDLIREDRER